LILHFGLGGGTPFTQKQIADIYGISQPHVYRQIRAILEKLRKRLEKPRGIEKTKK